MHSSRPLVLLAALFIATTTTLALPLPGAQSSTYASISSRLGFTSSSPRSHHLSRRATAPPPWEGLFPNWSLAQMTQYLRELRDAGRRSEKKFEVSLCVRQKERANAAESWPDDLDLLRAAATWEHDCQTQHGLNPAPLPTAPPAAAAAAEEEDSSSSSEGPSSSSSSANEEKNSNTNPARPSLDDDVSLLSPLSASISSKPAPSKQHNLPNSASSFPPYSASASAFRAPGAKGPRPRPAKAKAAAPAAAAVFDPNLVATHDAAPPFAATGLLAGGGAGVLAGLRNGLVGGVRSAATGLAGAARATGAASWAW